MLNRSVRSNDRTLRFIPQLAVLFFIGGSLIGVAGAQGSRREEALQLAGSNGLSSSSVAGHYHHGKSAAKVTDRSRSESNNDFLRAVWVPPEVRVNRIAPGKKRAFFTASSFIKPSVTVDQFLRYVGNRYRPGMDLALMRCRPSDDQRTNVQPFLATWPNVFPVIVSDLGGPNADCGSAATPGERQICRVASRYVDSPQTIYTFGLARTMVLGSRMFATKQRRDALNKDYGIFPAFTGLGFTVQASSTPSGETVPMTNREILRNSVVPEYLLKELPLADAGCRCVRVHESERLHTEPVDPAFIWKNGELVNGACPLVDDLESRTLRP